MRCSDTVAGRRGTDNAVVWLAADTDSTADGRRPKKEWTKEELAKVCYYHQWDSCFFGNDYKKLHTKVPAALREQVPHRSGPKGDGDKGKGKGGKDKGHWVGKSTSYSMKMYCKKFLDTGSCDDANCKGPFLDADEVKKVQDANPGKITTPTVT